jgi:peptidoglycan-N-acetylglucosamine deacetylase
LITLSCDDGCASDVKVALLAEKYEIPCVFYLPVEWRTLAYDNGYEPLNILEAYNIAQKHTIGSHTVTHRHLTKLNELEAQVEIADSKFMLEALFNKPVTKFCPPRGYISPEQMDYALTLYDSVRLTKGAGLLHIHPNSGANANTPWREYAKEHEVEEAWMHSWELDKYDLWDELEEWLSEVSHT